MNFLGNHREDNLPYRIPKNYAGATNYPDYITQIRRLPREKTAIIKWIRLGYSINTIAQGYGIKKTSTGYKITVDGTGHHRSPSFIHKLMRTALKRRLISFVDKRKLPSKTRLFCSGKRRKMFMRWLPLWIPFILGEADRPP